MVEAKVFGVDMARTSVERDAEKYKEMIFQRLGREYQGVRWGEDTKRLFESLQKQGRLRREDVYISKDSWVGHTSGKSITLGVAPIPEEIRQHIFFEPENFVGDQFVVYRFSHELSHVGASIASNVSSVGSLYTLAIAQRKQSGLGFSSLGSLDFYKQIGPEEQAKEDVVELFNMRLLDPDYFNRYLSFLTDKKQERVRKDRNLVSLDSAVVNHIASIISGGIQSLLI